jgi:hypothetical protein
MKRYLIVTVFSILTLWSFDSIGAYTIKVCTTANGVAVGATKSAWLCANDTVRLSVSNCGVGIPPKGLSYRWINIDVSPYTDTAKSTAMATVAGRWVGYILDSTTLIEYSDTVFLTNAPATSINSMSYSPIPPPVNAGKFCPLDEITASFTTTGTYTSYQWYDAVSGPDSLLAGATNSTLVFIRKPTVPVIVAQNIYGCYTRFQGAYADLAATIPVDLGPDILAACQGTTISVQNKPGGSATVLTGNITYKYFLEGNPTAICSALTPFPPPSTNYNSCSITLVNAGPKVKIWITVSHPFIACPNADTLNVNVTAIPVINLGPDSITCYNQTMSIKANITGKGPYDYTWTPAPTGYTTIGAPGSLSGHLSTTSSSASTSIAVTDISPVSSSNYYKLSVTDANSCGAGKDSILLTTNPKISTTVSSDTTICMYPIGTAQLNATASGGASALTYLWYPSTASYGLSSTSILNPTATPTYPLNSNTTKNKIYFFTATDVNHCSDTSSVKVTSYVPDITISANGIPVTSPPIVNETSPITLAATSSNPFSLTWKNWIDTLDSDTIYNFGTAPSSYIKSLGTNPTLDIEYNGPAVIFYAILAHNTNSPSNSLAPNSCLYNDTVKIKYISDNTLLYVPNIFSPNAVNSTNQHLRIYGDNLAPDGFKFLIYNKWGNLMYETTDLNEVKTNGWDGGSQIEGVYTYVIIGKFKNGKDVKESPSNRGTFSLVK